MSGTVTPASIDIVPFEPRFGAGVVDVILPIQREEFGFPITVDDQPDLLGIRNFYQQGNGNFWVALADGNVVGTIALLDIGRSEGALRKMFVKAPYRGPQWQVAQRLLDTLLAWGRARTLRTIYLGTTEKFRAAHRFYEKNGFHRVERDALPAGFQFMQVDTRFYARAP